MALIVPILPGLDAVRFSWTHVPRLFQMASFAGIAAGLAVLAWVMRENTYLLRFVDIQPDQRVITPVPTSSCAIRSARPCPFISYACRLPSVHSGNAAECSTRRASCCQDSARRPDAAARSARLLGVCGARSLPSPSGPLVREHLREHRMARSLLVIQLNSNNQRSYIKY